MVINFYAWDISNEENNIKIEKTNNKKYKIQNVRYSQLLNTRNKIHRSELIGDPLNCECYYLKKVSFITKYKHVKGDTIKEQ